MASPGKRRAMKVQNAKRRISGEAFTAQTFRSAKNNRHQYECGGFDGDGLFVDEPSRQKRKDLRRVNGRCEVC